jgi:hypothetical protein
MNFYTGHGISQLLAARCQQRQKSNHEQNAAWGSSVRIVGCF